jgi:hypothetical protein
MLTADSALRMPYFIEHSTEDDAIMYEYQYFLLFRYYDT